MNKEFLLEQVISELMDNKSSLVGPLMKLQYFATRTGNTKLLEFVLSELNGYKGKEILPDYRTSLAFINVDIQFGNNKHFDLEIPIEMIDGKHKNLFRQFTLPEAVSVLEQMSLSNEENKNLSNYLAINLPLTYIHYFQDPAANLYKNPYYKAKVVGARLMTNKNIISRALVSVRSRLLTFCLEIGSDFGYEISIENYNKSQILNNQKITNYMTTIINNNGDGNIASTGNNSIINANITINKGNKQQLVKKLEELNIDEEDIKEIIQIIEEEESTIIENINLGDNTIDWITKVSGKALKGVGSIAKEVTSSLLANLFLQYFGIPAIS
ncbi:hypothetical protein [Flavobacterium limnophilum]|uniref:AbiTii domain-containing protein n=1 Tax=Flavobacterium limnophilum TaxID=3003262 RepID=UPI00248237D1|nr:hypothetical protein [Flavobacterium limnophilum]